MATIKSYTDLEQSKKLAEFLPLESADYFHAPDVGIVATEPYKLNEDDETVITAYKGAVPCWSLAALMDILAKKALEFDDDGSAVLSSWMGKWEVHMYDCPIKCSDNYENPIDACMDIIEKLSKDGYINKEV